jgi:hypothetical protein
MSLILGNELPERAMNYLQVGRLVTMATVDERGWPDAAPISWIMALDKRTLRIAVSREVATYRNIQQNENVIISLLGGAMTLGIRGRARVISENMDGISLPMAMVEVIVDEVKDDSVIGRGIEEEIVKWEDRRRSVSDLSIETALRNGHDGSPEPAVPIDTEPQYNN